LRLFEKAAKNNSLIWTVFGNFIQNGITDVNYLFSVNVRFVDGTLSISTEFVKLSFKIEN